MSKGMVRVMTLALALTLALSGVAFAALPPESGISPLYLYIGTMSAGLSIDGAGSATCSGYVSTEEQVTQISLTMTLLRQNGSSWTTVTSWSTSVQNATRCYLEKYYNVSPGTYRVLVSVVITSADGDTEYGSVYSPIKSFGISPSSAL